MPVGGCELTVPPGAVRQYESEQAALFGRGLLAKQHTGLLREFEKPDALVEVGLVGVLMFAAQRQALALFFAPLCGLAIEEVGVDPVVKLVDVHGVDPVLQTVVFGLNPPDRILVVLLLVTVANAQGLRHPAISTLMP